MNRMNKKAQGSIGPIIAFIVVCMVVIMGALAVGLGSGIVTFTSKTINEATSGLGDISGTNMTLVQEMTIGTIDDTLQMIKWFSGFMILFGFLGLLISAAVIRQTGSRLFLGIYFVVVILLIIVSIFASNIYEDFYRDTGDIGLELQDMALQSFLILYMPHLITTIAFIGGIIIFSGIQEEFN